MRTYGVRDFSFAVLRKWCVEWILGGEGPEYPWQIDGDDAGPLALPAGVVWGNGGTGTLRWTYVPYELGIGIGVDVNGQPRTFEAQRYYEVFVESDGTPFTVEHPLGRFPPFIQFTQKFTGVTTEYFLYDIFGAGGSVQFIDNDTIVVDPGGPADLFIVLGG